MPKSESEVKRQLLLQMITVMVGCILVRDEDFRVFMQPMKDGSVQYWIEVDQDMYPTLVGPQAKHIVPMKVLIESIAAVHGFAASLRIRQRGPSHDSAA